MKASSPSNSISFLHREHLVTFSGYFCSVLLQEETKPDLLLFNTEHVYHLCREGKGIQFLIKMLSLFKEKAPGKGLSRPGHSKLLIQLSESLATYDAVKHQNLKLRHDSKEVNQIQERSGKVLLTN